MLSGGDGLPEAQVRTAPVHPACKLPDSSAIPGFRHLLFSVLCKAVPLRECGHTFPCSRLQITHTGVFGSFTRCVFCFQIGSGKVRQLGLFPSPSWLKWLDADSNTCKCTISRCWSPAAICPQAAIRWFYKKLQAVNTCGRRHLAMQQ